MAYLDVTNEDKFNDLLNTEKDLVIVDFWAPWCGPCKMFSPVFERVSDEVENVKFVKVNVDEAGEIAQAFNIMSIPSILLFKDGKVVDQKSGAMSDDQLKAWLDENSSSE